MNGGITHDEWNELVRALWRKLNVHVTVLESGGWQHPWQITPAWDGARWMGSIRTGFINGRDPYIRVPTKEAPVATLARLRASASASSIILQPSSFTDAWLTEFPRLALDGVRPIGPDALPTTTSTTAGGAVSLSWEPVPAYFANLGVGPAPSGEVNAETGITIQPQEDGHSRLLRALDVILEQPRMATESDFQQSEVTNATVFQYNVSTKNTAAVRERARIRTVPEYKPPAAQDPLQQLAGIWADDGLSTLHLASVYFVSPPGAAFGSVPDASWTPYLAHKVFWSPRFATNQLPDALADERLTLNTGLAAGLGDAMNSFLLSQVNDANSAISQFLGRSTIEGRFWT